jgi:hypothetical protein
VGRREANREQLHERLQKEGVRTHKEKVEELNKYLSNLSEHHDMYVPFPENVLLEMKWRWLTTLGIIGRGLGRDNTNCLQEGYGRGRCWKWDGFGIWNRIRGYYERRHIWPRKQYYKINGNLVVQERVRIKRAYPTRDRGPSNLALNRVPRNISFPSQLELYPLQPCSFDSPTLYSLRPLKLTSPHQVLSCYSIASLEHELVRQLRLLPTN